MSGSIRDRERLAAEAYERLRRGNTYEDWVAVGFGLLAGREWAIQQAGAAKGTRYNHAIQQWQARNQWALAPELKHPATSQAIWLIENLADVEAWRATLSDADRLAYNHPGTIQRHFRRAQAGQPSGPGRGHRGQGAGPTSQQQGNPSRPSKAAFDALKAALDQALAENAAKDQEITDLKARLAAGGGPAGYPQYPLLWLDGQFTRKQLQAARNRMAKACHPDAGGSTEQQQALNAEYQRALKAATK